jgi:hypothetical protein
MRRKSGAARRFGVRVLAPAAVGRLARQEITMGRENQDELRQEREEHDRQRQEQRDGVKDNGADASQDRRRHEGDDAE